MDKDTLRIGASGWSYPHWTKGVFYPRGLKQGEWLRFFSERFATVEVNMTFYRLPAAAMLGRWVAITPPHFLFAVKLWRRITHEKKLLDCGENLVAFSAAMEVLGNKRGPLLVQLPPSLTRDADRLDGFLTTLNQAPGKRWPRVAVEFRNPSWLCPQVYSVLDRHGAAVCLADMPRCPITETNQAGFVYVRRHGPAGRYQGGYTADQLHSDASAIRTWLQEGRDVYVYFNNDIGGHAVTNARQLMELLE